MYRCTEGQETERYRDIWKDGPMDRGTDDYMDTGTDGERERERERIEREERERGER